MPKKSKGFAVEEPANPTENENLSPFAYCREGQDIVYEMVDEVHTHLDGTCVLFLLTTEKLRDGRKQVAAMSKIVSGLPAWLARDTIGGSPMFVLLFSGTAWGNADAALRRALIDEQLCSMDVDAKGKLGLKGPDVRGFRENIQRHGLFSDPLKLFAKDVAEWQHKLPEMEEVA